MSDFTDQDDLAFEESIDVMGEAVTVGPWTGQAIVNGGPAIAANTRGGTYDKATLTIVVSRRRLAEAANQAGADLATYLPAPRMKVDARGKALRIPDDGIVEYRSSFTITAVGREVPR